MKMTLKNKMLMRIKKLNSNAEKLGYIPDTIEITKDELRDLVNELCVYKSKHYKVLYKDRRREADGPGIESSIASVFLQHRPNAVFDMIVDESAKLAYRDGIEFVIVEEPEKEPEKVEE